MILQNEFLHIEISAMGAELMRIYDRKNETELLFNGDPAYWKRRAPILFPNVGKTYGNTMRINGAPYPTGQHGFARDMEFILESAGETNAVYLLRSGEATLPRYPFEFELRIEYRLNGPALEVIWSVHNPSGEEIAFTIGGHPAFCFASAEEKKEAYCVELPGCSAIRYRLLDPASGTALPDVREIALENGMLPLSDALFAHDALILDDMQVQEAWLCHADGRRRVGMICKGFPNFGIWSVQGAPFVCLEPWQGRCDDCGYDGELRNKPNVTRLAPGETFRKAHSVVLPD